MEKYDAVAMVYQIATLTHPCDEVMELLMSVSYERTFKLLLIMRQSPKQPIRSPLNFLRRAIEENWSAATIPKKLNRRIQNHEEAFYVNRGMTAEAAKAKAFHDVLEGYYA